MKQWAAILKIKNNSGLRLNNSFIIKHSASTPLHPKNPCLQATVEGEKRFIHLEKAAFLKIGVTGFTMVEALVVIVIFSILSVSISASFISGMKVWSRAKNVSLGQTDVLINLEKICSELRQIVTIPQVVYEGSSTQISFAHVHGNSIYKVSYIFDPEEKMLVRRQADLKYILEGKEEENRTEKNLLSLDEFSLSYLYLDPEDSSYKWKDNWESADGRFLAVKIQEKLKDEEFKRTIFIPVSS
ncbi:MAG: type II secretion system protein [Candidatus Omnitrophota bacterium]